MKKTIIKKLYLTAILSVLCVGSWAQNNLFFGFSPFPLGGVIYNINPYKVNFAGYDTTWYGLTGGYKIVDGFFVSIDNCNDFAMSLNYQHGKLLNYTTNENSLSIGDDFRQIYIQWSRAYRLNSTHRVQFPINIGMILGGAWTQKYSNFNWGAALNAKMVVYVTDNIGIYVGGNALYALGFGKYKGYTECIYLDFGLTYTIADKKYL